MFRYEDVLHYLEKIFKKLPKIYNIYRTSICLGFREASGAKLQQKAFEEDK